MKRLAIATLAAALCAPSVRAEIAIRPLVTNTTVQAANIRALPGGESVTIDLACSGCPEQVRVWFDGIGAIDRDPDTGALLTQEPLIWRPPIGGAANTHGTVDARPGLHSPGIIQVEWGTPSVLTDVSGHQVEQLLVVDDFVCEIGDTPAEIQSCNQIVVRSTLSSVPDPSPSRAAQPPR